MLAHMRECVGWHLVSTRADCGGFRYRYWIREDRDMDILAEYADRLDEALSLARMGGDTGSPFATIEYVADCLRELATERAE